MSARNGVRVELLVVLGDVVLGLAEEGLRPLRLDVATGLDQVEVRAGHAGGRAAASSEIASRTILWASGPNGRLMLGLGGPGLALGVVEGPLVEREDPLPGRLDEPLAELDRLGQDDLLLGGQQGDLADLLEVHPDRDRRSRSCPRRAPRAPPRSAPRAPSRRASSAHRHAGRARRRASGTTSTSTIGPTSAPSLRPSPTASTRSASSSSSSSSSIVEVDVDHRHPGLGPAASRRAAPPPPRPSCGAADRRGRPRRAACPVDPVPSRSCPPWVIGDRSRRSRREPRRPRPVG